jgi:predicted TIM-barrel fold metal-dependent hydrolase
MSLTFDVHTHVGLDLGFFLRSWWPYSATAQDLLGHMDAHGIDRAVCFPFTLPSAFDPYAFAAGGELKLLSGRVPFDQENTLLRTELDRVDHDGRLLQFAMFDPGRCIKEQLKLLELLVGKIRGLKTQTTVLQSPIRELLNGGRPLMELAARHDLPVLFHTAVSPADPWAQGADCLAVARAFPQVRFNLAHSIRFHVAHLEAAAELPNVWVDCSAHLAHCQLASQNAPAVAAAGDRVKADYSKPAQVLQTVHQMLGGKYMWGSDNPFMSWCADRMAVIFSYAQEAAVLRELSEDVRTSMLSLAPRAWLFGAKGTG